jgi:hypothetical protein
VQYYLQTHRKPLNQHCLYKYHPIKEAYLEVQVKITEKIATQVSLELKKNNE